MAAEREEDSMSVRKGLGVLLTAAPLAVILTAEVVSVGWANTLLMLSVVGAAVLCLTVGSYLLSGPTDPKPRTWLPWVGGYRTAARRKRRTQKKLDSLVREKLLEASLAEEEALRRIRKGSIGGLMDYRAQELAEQAEQRRREANDLRRVVGEALTEDS